MARISYVVEGFDEDAVYDVFESDMADRYVGKEGADGSVQEELYRTDYGVWVLNLVTDKGVGVDYMKVKDTRASLWLKTNGYGEAVSRWFDRPSGGRPSKGEKIGIRVPQKQLAYVDSLAQKWRIPRADALARMAVLGVAHHKLSAWFDHSRKLEEGVMEAVRGETVDRGDFSRYLTDEM